MYKLIALLALFFLMSAYPASADGAKCANPGEPTSYCEVMKDQGYKGGGYDPKVVPLTACLSSEMYESIKLDNGRAFWEAGFYYGKDKPEVVATVKNDACWTKGKQGQRQHGHPGSWVVAFICCDYYCGWVGGVIPPSGRVQLRPIALPEGHDPLKQYRVGSGGYDRSQILVNR